MVNLLLEEFIKKQALPVALLVNIYTYIKNWQEHFIGKQFILIN
jgi:hypothetical protein